MKTRQQKISKGMKEMHARLKTINMRGVQYEQEYKGVIEALKYTNSAEMQKLRETMRETAKRIDTHGLEGKG